MKMLAATAILAVAALAAPAAVGQSQGIPLDPFAYVAAAGAELVQVSAQAVGGGKALTAFERTGGDAGVSPVAPDPLVSWAMAIVFLGLVVMRRTRSPMR
ncbi:MAG TPA: hypothetical protein VEC19_08215 [Usitatibacter sp.]|nr:hypothetical protein [Usitatibacter sp.]